MAGNKKNPSKLFRDFSIIAASVAVSLFLLSTGAIEEVLTSTAEFKYLGIFVAGLFFTSVFTTAPAIVILGEFALASPLWLVAALGALGALIGDLVIFRFVRNDLAGDFTQILSRTARHHLHVLSELRLFRWLIPFIGALIIASPLPDELGLALLGFSKVPLRFFVPVSLAFNALGIVLIGLVARSLV